MIASVLGVYVRVSHGRNMVSFQGQTWRQRGLLPEAPRNTLGSSLLLPIKAAQQTRPPEERTQTRLGPQHSCWEDSLGPQDWCFISVENPGHSRLVAWCGCPEKASKRAGRSPRTRGKKVGWASQSQERWGWMGRCLPSCGTLGPAHPQLLALTHTQLSPR